MKNYKEKLSMKKCIYILDVLKKIKLVEDNNFISKSYDNVKKLSLKNSSKKIIKF